MKTTGILLYFIAQIVLVETGAGGRHYDARTARWLIPDPALRDGDPQKQMKKYGRRLFESCPYSYSFNNPLRYVDQDGKWPTRTHNLIIDKAFGSLVQSGQMSSRNLAMIKAGSLRADADQSTYGSYKHAMNGPGDLTEATKVNMGNFIDSKLGEFVSSLNSDPDKAFTALGEALHPVMDATSPAHEGFQEWKGIEGETRGTYDLTKVLSGIAHGLKESGYDEKDPRVQKAILLTRLVYDATMQGNKEVVDETIQQSTQN